MTAITANELRADQPAAPVVALPRRTIDSVLVGLGAVVTAVLIAAGGLLTWGARFSNDYVHDELSSQNISFPDAASLQSGGRADLVRYAGARVDTGKEAEAYASYIDGHLAAVADGKTYADLSAPERAAKAAVTDAKAKGAPDAEVADLQAKATAITAQRTTLFQGETLRGLLLSAFAWSTVGRIAGIAAWTAFAAAGAMFILVGLGIRHRRIVAKA
jgi:hypothetical protein